MIHSINGNKINTNVDTHFVNVITNYLHDYRAKRCKITRVENGTVSKYYISCYSFKSHNIILDKIFCKRSTVKSIFFPRSSTPELPGVRNLI